MGSVKVYSNPARRFNATEGTNSVTQLAQGGNFVVFNGGAWSTFSRTNPYGGMTDFRWLSIWVCDYDSNSSLKYIPRNNITSMSITIIAHNDNNDRPGVFDQHPIIISPSTKTITGGYNNWLTNSLKCTVTSPDDVFKEHKVTLTSKFLDLLYTNNLSIILSPAKPDQSLTNVNFYLIPESSPVPLEYMVRHTLDNNQANAYLEISYNNLTPLPPTALTPNSTSRDPFNQIIFNWYFNAQAVSGVTPDVQANAELRYRKNNGNWTTVITNNYKPEYILNLDNVVNGDLIEWQVKAQGRYHGWSEWSETASFTISPAPPLAPLLNYPINISFNASSGFSLEWTYRSEVDTFPTGFDVEYIIDDDAPVVLEIRGNPADNFAFVDASITEEKIIKWRVRSYSELGSVSDWSNQAEFFTIGSPQAPTIVRIDAVSRPTVFFFSESLVAYDLDILQNDKVIYSSGVISFDNIFSYKVIDFLSNGQYLCRLKVINAYGYISQPALQSFYVDVPSLPSVQIKSASRLPTSIRLYLNEYVKCIVYRNNERIAIIEDNVFNDFTCSPDIDYDYFVRTYNDESFADSNIVKASTSFVDTFLAEVNAPSKLLSLKKMLNGKPKKSSGFQTDIAIMNFIGRENPVVEQGEHEIYQLDFSFFVDAITKKELERLQKSTSILILRDVRFGSVYGKITSFIKSDATSRGFIVSFSFTRLDYSYEVTL